MMTSDPLSRHKALLVIDMQKRYCCPWFYASEDLDILARRIAETVPRFRNGGVPVYAVYFRPFDPDISQPVDWHRFHPAPGDTVLRKYGPSAFCGSNLRETLQKNGVDHLLVCGVYADSCVLHSVLDALPDFSVTLLTDLTASGRISLVSEQEALACMKKKGARMRTSQEELGSMPSPADLRQTGLLQYSPR